MTIDARGLLEGTTPGDWRAQIWRNSGMADTVCVYGDRQREIIAWSGFAGVPCTKAEIRANAKLAAAAPALARDNIAKDATIERLMGAISWIEPPFVDEKTSHDELRQRVGIAVKDAALATKGRVSDGG